ncbi:unnamed protein product [Meloidogyne enterolobii]|uniref:Uncharacterized protein n=2 Tax=Meloidogyne enterolobii TaxID=390850 RepID=A0ACB0YZG9_MELEN
MKTVIEENENEQNINKNNLITNGQSKNWVSFNKEKGEDGGSILLSPVKMAANSSSSDRQPTALLEPIELNDIPLNDLDSTQQSPKQNNNNIGIPPPLPPPPIPPPRPTTKPQKERKKEIILEIGAGTSNSSNGGNTEGGSNNNYDDGEGDKNSEELKNGKLLVIVYPSNAHCAWLVPPKYDYKMPSKLANNKQIEFPQITFEDIIRTISNDLRFFSYAVIYSRLTPIWLIFSIIILLAVLASSPAGGGFPILIFTIVWLLMLLLGLLLCVFIRKYIVLSLRNLMKDVNKISFLQYKILIGVQDRGQLSCHKVALMFIFLDPNGCKEEIIKQLRIYYGRFSPTATQKPFTEDELLSEAENLLCHYSQEYAKAYMKRRFILPARPTEGVSEYRPKHCQRNLCLCQFIEREHFNKKSEKESAPWYEKLFAP